MEIDVTAGNSISVEPDGKTINIEANSTTIQVSAPGPQGTKGDTGIGDVSKVGTPVNNQIGVWTGDSTLEGDSKLIWDGTALVLATGTTNLVDFLKVTHSDNDWSFRINQLGEFIIRDETGANGPFKIGTGAGGNSLHIEMDAIIINESQNDTDFRVLGNSEANLLFVDAGLDQVGIGTATTTEKLTVAGNIAVSGTVDDINVGVDVAANTLKVGAVYSFNRITGLTTQAVTSTLAAITWSASSDSSGSDVTFSGVNPTRLTAVTTGVYRVGGYVTISSAAQRAQAAIEIMIDGVATGLQRSGAYIRNSGTSYDFWTLEMSGTPISLTAGQYVEMGVGQVTGATYGYGGVLAINAERIRSEFWLERVQ